LPLHHHHRLPKEMGREQLSLLGPSI